MSRERCHLDVPATLSRLRALGRSADVSGHGSTHGATTLFDPAAALTLTEQEQATILHGFDIHFHDLMDHPHCASTDRSSLRTGLLAAGMAIPEPVARQAQRLLCKTLTGWGMTERGWVGGLLSFLDSSEDDR